MQHETRALGSCCLEADTNEDAVDVRLAPLVRECTGRPVVYRSTSIQWCSTSNTLPMTAIGRKPSLTSLLIRTDQTITSVRSWRSVLSGPAIYQIKYCDRGSVGRSFRLGQDPYAWRLFGSPKHQLCGVHGFARRTTDIHRGALCAGPLELQSRLGPRLRSATMPTTDPTMQLPGSRPLGIVCPKVVHRLQ